jgi:hypothetical protein
MVNQTPDEGVCPERPSGVKDLSWNSGVRRLAAAFPPAVPCNTTSKLEARIPPVHRDREERRQEGLLLPKYSRPLTNNSSQPEVM